MKRADLVQSWGKILRGRIPLLSIEITKECPLSCPGCYAYGDSHLAGTTLRQVNELRGDELVNGILGLVDQHDPLQLSLVGGEPLMRHKELSQVLPVLSQRGVWTMVVTSAVIPIPKQWMELPRVTVAVSVDGLQPEHDVRRKPATYERILKNIADCKVNIHWTIVRSHMQRPGYLDDYLAFWSNRPEVNRIWISTYTPQRGEQTPEMLTQEDFAALAEMIPRLRKNYPKLLIADGMAKAWQKPPANPEECIFSRMSVNYTADFRTRVEPCIFGGDPDCSQCGCAISVALHWVNHLRVLKPVPFLEVGHLVRGSMRVGRFVNRLRPAAPTGIRWSAEPSTTHDSGLVQIQQ